MKKLIYISILLFSLNASGQTDSETIKEAYKAYKESLIDTILVRASIYPLSEGFMYYYDPKEEMAFDYEKTDTILKDGNSYLMYRYYQIWWSDGNLDEFIKNIELWQ